MNSQLGFVRSWLSSLFGSDDVPSFEVNETTISALYEVAKMSVERQKEQKALTELLRVQTNEYRAETKRIMRVMTALGISDGHAAAIGPVKKFAEILAEVAQLLDVDDPDIANLSIALADVQMKTSRIPLDDFTMKRKEEEEKTLRLQALQELHQHEKVLITSEAEVKKNVGYASQVKSKIEFVARKQNEYAESASKKKRELQKSGVSSEVEHEALVTMKAELTAMQQRLEPMRAKLNGYQQLPPNLELAKLKVAEAQKELDELTQKLTEGISALHV
jgi:hypothetical protein